jgi:hypothetical protein
MGVGRRAVVGVLADAVTSWGLDTPSSTVNVEQLPRPKLKYSSVLQRGRCDAGHGGGPEIECRNIRGETPQIAPRDIWTSGRTPDPEPITHCREKCHPEWDRLQDSLAGLYSRYTA